VAGAKRKTDELCEVDSGHTLTGMSEIQDLHLNHSADSSDFELRTDTDAAALESVQPSERRKWLALIVMFIAAAAVLGFVVWQRNKVTPPPTQAAQVPAPSAAAAPKPASPLVEAERFALPPLAESDAVVRQLVVKLSSHPKVLAWLATDRLIENFAVVALNVSEGKTPVAHLRALAPQARFSVLNANGGVVIDPKTYRRYDEFAAAVSGLDSAGTARLYLTLKPRITDAYRELGFPEGDFDRVLESAIKPLVNTSPIETNAALLREKVLSYHFVDPTLESLTSAQKQLLRMGPENMRRVQDKLRDIATQLGLHL
jgi:hypothetical protein